MRRINFIRMLSVAFILSSFSLFAVAVSAQDIYPAKKITYVCASEAGGGMSLLARGVAPFLSKYLKELNPGAKGGDVEVKNMPGASHAKAMNYIFTEAKPDGYTIGDFIRGNVYKFTYGQGKLPYDVREATWLAEMGMNVRVLVSNKKKFSTWEEMLAASQKEPLTFECSSVGSSEQLDTIFLKEIVGIPGKITFSGGSSQTAASLIRGDTDVSLVDYAPVKALIESGEINVLASMTRKRIMPNVPTIIEKGFPEVLKFLEGECGNRMVIAPPKLAPEAKRKLLAAFKKTFDDPEFKAFRDKVGITQDTCLDEQVKEEIVQQAELLRKMAPTLKKYGL
jgi:tripartite-type tricarboxylate transporter receptor subunit TctC